MLKSGVVLASLGSARALAAAGLANSSGPGADIAIVRAALSLHPGLHRYLSPSAVEVGLAQLERSWHADTALDRRYLSLARFLATIRCGHSYANFFNQNKAVAAALFDRPTRLPVQFAWVGEAMVVTDGRATGLPRGAIIQSLNAERPAMLRRRLIPYVRADGHNDAKRVSLLEVRGDDRIETFDVFQGLLAPPPGGVHRLTVSLPDGRAQTLELPALYLPGRVAQMAPDAASADTTRWQWRQGRDGIAVLTMPGWGLWGSKWDWRTWLGERLDSLDGARGLIIDIRDNEGGEDCGDLILARLIGRDFLPPRSRQLLRFRRTPADLDRYLDTWDDSFRTLGEGAMPLAGGFYLRPGGDAALRITPSGKPIHCPVRVLTSPVNSSATFQFASNLRAIGTGALVGRPTGGNRRGINGGCFFFVRLPDSGLEFDLPLVGYFPSTPQPDAGLMPDITAPDTIASIIAGRDLAMAAAVRSLVRA